MEYEALTKVKSILSYEVQARLELIANFEEKIKQLKVDKRNLNNIVKNREINVGTLQLVMGIIEKNELNIIFDRTMYSTILGVYYIDPTDQNKQTAENLLKPIQDGLDLKMDKCKESIVLNQDRLEIVKKLEEALNGLINYKENSHMKAIGNDILDSFLNYIFKIPADIMSDEEKTLAMYEFNVLNVEALQSKEKLITGSTSNTNYTEKPMSKTRFEYENSSLFVEIEDLVSIYSKLSSNLTEKQKNQMLTISKQIDLEILSDENKKKLETLIENIMADFTVDYYIKFILLKNINDWYDLYKNSYNEEEWTAIFDEIEGFVDSYQGYIEKEEDVLPPEAISDNDVIFLVDNNEVIVGFDWMRSDSHEYTVSDNRDLINGFDKIKTRSRDFLMTNTYKVKGAGIPGVPESKFRRLRLGTARIIFLDLTCLIKEQYIPYVQDLDPCYLVINFGQKSGETDIYKSVNIKESPRIPNLIEEFQKTINDQLEAIISSNDLSEKDKKQKVEELFKGYINKTNEYYIAEKDQLKGFGSKKDDDSRNPGNGGNN